MKFGQPDRPGAIAEPYHERDVWRCTVRCVQTHQDVVVTDGNHASQCEDEFKNCNVSAPPNFEAEAGEQSSSACG